MTVAKFTKRPSIVEAIPWIGSNTEEVREFCIDEDGDSVILNSNIRVINDEYSLVIQSALGRQIVPLGTWIVKEKGQFFVCDAEEFLREYEPKNS